MCDCPHALQVFAGDLEGISLLDEIAQQVIRSLQSSLHSSNLNSLLNLLQTWVGVLF